MNPIMDYLTEDEEAEMVAATTSPAGELPRAIFSREEILELQELVLKVPAADEVIRPAVHLVAMTRPKNPDAPALVKEKVSWGAGSRASQALVLAGKARALLHGRAHLATEDIKALAQPVLRHRIIPNFHAEAENMTSDHIIKELTHRFC
jgi:MoxR-like ATPase